MTSNNGYDESNDELMEDVLQMELTEEAYEELAASEGAAIAELAFWSASLADELEETPPTPEDRQVIDIDIYLDDNTLLELYGVSLFRSESAEPITGLEALEAALVDMAGAGGVLYEVAETDEGDLALVFAVEDELCLIMVVGAWSVSDWDELPTE
ncbi:MAG: hypothetical protein KDH89_05960 [Anaerolineae bacterium]|nr:hypothetical protein [Anaerolineae bacterium]